MQIDPPHRPLTLQLPPTGGARAALELQLGQQLAARVHLTADGVMLELDDVVLQAAGRPPLRDGQWVRLLVTQLQPQVQLQMLNEEAAEAPLQQALRQLLPQPSSQTALPRQLAELLQAPGTRLPAPVNERLTGLLALLPDPARLSTAEGLRQALRGSGLLLEPLLAAEPDAVAPQRDLKAALLRLAETLRQQLAEGDTTDAETAPLRRLLETAEGGLQRLQLLQLHAASSDSVFDLIFEIPLRLQNQLENLQLRLRRERDGGTEADGEPGAAGLQVQLGFEFADAGRLQVALALRGEALSLYCWAERPALAASVAHHLPELRQRLEALGLTVRELGSRQGKGPEILPPATAFGGLLREKA